MAEVIQKLGILNYENAWQLQRELLEKRANQEIPDTLLSLEHPHVITLGKKSLLGRTGDETRLPKEIGGVPAFYVERGGEATYHGPGQLVCYPIFFMPLSLGPKAFLRMMENAIIHVLSEFEILSYFIEGKTGVWVKDTKGRERKIASLGIAVRKNVSYHGLALNISTDLSYFSLISPCGFASEVMTSMEEILQKKISFSDVEEKLLKTIIAFFAKEHAAL